MFSKSARPPALKSAATRKTAPSVISNDMNILGNIICDGFMDIDGRVEGNIKCYSLILRSNGKIVGDVMAESVQVYGEIKGLVKAKNVQLFASCKVEGIIMHEALSIEDGAFVDGKFKRTDKISRDDITGEDDPEMNEHEQNINMLEHIRLISS